VFYKRSAAGRTAQLVEAALVALRAGGGAAVRITFTGSGTRAAVTVTPVLLPPSNSSSGPISNRLYLGISGSIGFQRQSPVAVPAMLWSIGVAMGGTLAHLPGRLADVAAVHDRWHTSRPE